MRIKITATTDRPASFPFNYQYPLQAAIYSLIREALEITNFTFLKYLTEPGLDGHPFIDKKDMSLLVNVTGQIGMKTPKDRSFDDRDSQIAGYYVNKTIKMYNHWGKVDKPRKK